MNFPCMIVKKGCICKGAILNNAYLRKCAVQERKIYSRYNMAYL